jgi:hypothetical protein
LTSVKRHAARSGRATAKVIVRMPVGTRVTVYLLAAFMWVEITSVRPDSWVVVLTQGVLIVSFGAGLCLAAVGSRMTIDSSGVRVQNFFLERRLSWDQLTTVRWDNGLDLHLRNGRVVGVVALGGSIISQLTKNRRQHRAAEAIESLRPLEPSTSVESETGTAQLSARAVVVATTVFVLYYASGIVAFAVSH